MTPEWLGTTDVAQQLGLTVRTVYRLINDGQLAAHRIGRVIRIRRDDLDAYMQGSRVPPGGLDHLVGTAGSARAVNAS